MKFKTSISLIFPQNLWAVQNNFKRMTNLLLFFFNIKKPSVYKKFEFNSGLVGFKIFEIRTINTHVNRIDARSAQQDLKI